MAFIEIDHLSMTFQSHDSAVNALQEVSLSLDEAGFYGILGPSGSGKSTLLAILGGLSTPTSGTVLIDEIDLYSLPGEKLADFRREYLGFVFQSFNLIPYLSALENVLLPLTVKPLPTDRKRELARRALERVGLSARATHLPGQLSGGEQERVAIARALVNNPPLILADEPTGSLDSDTAQNVMRLLKELHEDGQTIVMVTHNPENRDYFSHSILLRDGVVSH